MTEISPEEGGAANGCKERTDAPLMASFSSPHAFHNLWKQASSRDWPSALKPLYTLLCWVKETFVKMNADAAFIVLFSEATKRWGKRLKLTPGPTNMDDLLRLQGSFLRNVDAVWTTMAGLFFL